MGSYIDNWRVLNPDASKDKTDMQVALALLATDPSAALRIPELNKYKELAQEKSAQNKGLPYGQNIARRQHLADEAAKDRGFLTRTVSDPIARGWLMAEQANILNGITGPNASYSKEQAEALFSIRDRMQKIGRNKHMEEMERAKGFTETAREFLGFYETPSIIWDVGLESMAAMFRQGAPKIAAGLLGGAAAGARYGGTGGSAAGATYGLAATMGHTSFQLSSANHFLSAVEKAAGPQIWRDPEALASALSDPKINAAARKEALAYGLTVGAFDAFSVGLAGRVAAVGERAAMGLESKLLSVRKAAKIPKDKGLLDRAIESGLLGSSKVASPATQIGFQGTMGGVGDGLGQVAAEGKVTSWQDVFLEAVAEFGMAPVDITVGKLTRNISAEDAKALNNQIRAFARPSKGEGVSSTEQKSEVDDLVKEGYYNESEGEVYKAQIDEVYKYLDSGMVPPSERGAKTFGMSKADALKAIVSRKQELSGEVAPAETKSDFDLESEPTTTEPEKQWFRGSQTDTEKYRNSDQETRDKMVADKKIELVDQPDISQMRIKGGKVYDSLNLGEMVSKRAEESRASRSSKLLEGAGVDVGNIGLDDKNLGALGSALSDDDQMGFDDVMSDLRDAEGNAFEGDGKYSRSFQEIFDEVADGHAMTPEGKDLMNAFGVAMDGRQEASTEAATDAVDDEGAVFAAGRGRKADDTQEFNFDPEGTDTARFEQEVRIITQSNERKSKVNEENIAAWRELHPRADVDKAIEKGKIRIEPLAEVPTRQQWDTKAPTHKGKDRGEATFVAGEGEVEVAVEAPARAESAAIKKWRKDNPDIQSEYSESQVAIQLFSDSIRAKKVAKDTSPTELGAEYKLVPEDAKTTVSENEDLSKKLNRLLREEIRIQAVLDDAILKTKQGASDPNLAIVQKELDSRQSQIVALSEKLGTDVKADPKEGHPLFDADLHEELSTEDYGLFAEYKNPPFKYLEGSRKGEQMDTSLAETWRRTATKYAKNFRYTYGSESNDWAWEAFTKTLQKAQEVVSDMKEHGRDYMNFSATKNAYLKFAGGKILKNAFFDLSRKAENRKRIEENQASPSSAGHQTDNAAGWGFRTLDERAEITGVSVEEFGAELDEHSSKTKESISNAVASGMAEGGVTGGLPERTPRAIAIREKANRFIAKAVELVNKNYRKRMGFDKKPSSAYEKWGAVELGRRITRDIIAEHFVSTLEHRNLIPKKLSTLLRRRYEINKELPRLEEAKDNLNGKRFTSIIKAVNSHIAKITVGNLYSEEAVQGMVSADIRAGVHPISAETIVTHRSQLEEEVIRLIENGILPKDSDAIIQIPSGATTARRILRDRGIAESDVSRRDLISLDEERKAIGGGTVGISAKQLLVDIESRKSMLERQLKRIEASIDVINSETAASGTVRGFPMGQIRNEIRNLYNEFNRERADILDDDGNPLTQLNVPLISRDKGQFSDAKLTKQYKYILSQAQSAVSEANIEEDAFVRAMDDREAYAKKKKGKTAEFRGDLLDRNTPLFDQLKGNFSVSYALDNLRTKLTGKAAKFAERMEPLTNLMAGLKTQTFIAEINEHRGDDRPAFYDFYHNRIAFDGRGMTHEKAFRTMVEEGLHALTSDKLASDAGFRRRVQGFLNKANRVRLSDPDKYGHLNDYAFENVHEFIAHSLMDSDLQQFLSSIKSSVKDRGGIVDLYRSILDAIAKVLGLTPDEATLLDDVVYASAQAAQEKLHGEPVKLRGVRVREKAFTITQRPDLYTYSENLSFGAWQPFQLDPASIDHRADPKTLTHDEAAEKIRALRVSLGPKGIAAAFDDADVEITEAFAQPRPDPAKLPNRDLTPDEAAARKKMIRERAANAPLTVRGFVSQIRDSSDALKEIASGRYGEDNALLAKELSKGGRNVPISFNRGKDISRSDDPDFEGETGGRYKLAKGEAIEIAGNYPFESEAAMVKILLHEIAHSRTLEVMTDVLENPDNKFNGTHRPVEWLYEMDDRINRGYKPTKAERAVMQLVSIFDAIETAKYKSGHWSALKSEYGTTNVLEMVAEAYSSPRFRDILDSIKASDLGLPYEKIGTVWAMLRRRIARMLGLSEGGGSVLGKIMESTNVIIASSEKSKFGVDEYSGQRTFFHREGLAPDSALQNVRDKQDLTKRTEGPTRASMSIYEKFKEQLVTKSQILDSFVKRMFKDKGISHDLEVPLAGLHELLSGSVQSANAAVDNFVYDVEALIGNKEKTTKQWNDFVLLERIKERLRNDRDSKVKDGLRIEQLEEKIDTTGDVETWKGTDEEKIELIQLLVKSKEVHPYKSVADITRPNGLNDGIRELIAEINDPSLLTETESGVYTGKFVEAAEKSQTHLEESLFRMFEAGLITHRGYNRIASGTSFYVPFYVAKHFSGEDTFGQFIKGIKEEVELAPMMDAIKFKIYTTKLRVDKNVFMGKIDDFREEFDPEGTHIRVMDADEFKSAEMEPNWDAAKFYRNGRLHYIKMEKDITDLFNNFNPASATFAGRALKGAGDIFKLGATGINMFFQAGNFLIFDPIRLLATSKAGLRAKDKGLSPIVLGHQYLKALMAASWRNLTPNSIKNLIRSSTTFDTTKMDTLYQKFIDSGAAGSTIAEYFDKARGIPDPVGKHGGIFRDEGKITKGLNWLNAKFSLVGKTLEQTAKMVGMQRMEIFEGIDELITEVEAEKNVEKKMRLQKALEKKRDAIAIEIRNFAGSPDFMRKGKFTENEALNVVFMFFNARIQGVERDMSRLSKVFSGKKADRNLALATGLKLSAFAAAPTMMVWAMNRRHKDDYDEISDEEKKRYFMIPLSTKFEHPYIEGKMIRDYIRIPRRESFGVFSYTLEKGLDFFYEEDPHAAAEAVEFMVESILPVNVDGLLELRPVKTAESVASSMNPMIKGVFEQLGNRNFFRHKPLVPPSMENADPEDQYYTSTPDIYKWLGGSTGLGALRAKHLTESMTAGMFTQFMPPKDTGREGFASTPVLHRLARSSYIRESDIAEIMDAADKVDATGRVQRRRMADEWFRRTKGMSVQERVMNLPRPKNHSEKLLRDLIVRRLREQAVGLDPDEIRMKHSPVNVRASVVLSQIEDMTPEEVKVYLTDLARKRILTRETIIAVNQRLRSRGVTLRDYVQ